MEPISTAVFVKWAVTLVAAAVVVKLTIATIKLWIGLCKSFEKLLQKKIPKVVHKLNSEIEKVIAEVEPIVDKFIEEGKRIVKFFLWVEDENGNQAYVGEDTTSYDGAAYETKQHLDQGGSFEAIITN